MPATPEGAVTGGQRPWLIVRCDDDFGPGLVTEVLAETGRAAVTARVLDGGALEVDPDAGAGGPTSPGEAYRYGGVVVLGGRQRASAAPGPPPAGRSSDALGAILRSAVAEDVPVLALGSGARRLVDAMGHGGARFDSGEIDHRHVRFGLVELTASGRKDQVLGPEYGGLSTTTIPCLWWATDSDRPASSDGLPDGSIHLAASRECPVAAFRFGRSAYGFAFHPEADRILVEGWRRIAASGAAPDDDEVERAAIVGRRIIRRLILRDAEPTVGRATAAAGAHS